MQVYVYDKEVAGIDRYMGECVVDISTWSTSSSTSSNTCYDGEISILNRRGKVEGVLLISAKYNKKE